MKFTYTVIALSEAQIYCVIALSEAHMDCVIALKTGLDYIKRDVKCRMVDRLNVTSDQHLLCLLLIKQFLDTSTDSKMDSFWDKYGLGEGRERQCIQRVYWK